MKKKFITSSIVAASITSSIFQINPAFATKSAASQGFFYKAKQFWEKSKVKIVSTLAAVGALFVKKKVFDITSIRKVKEGDDVPDVEGMAQDCSHMFLTMDRKKFEDSIKNAEFYQLYSAYKVGYNGFIPTSEKSKAEYRDIIFKELDRRLDDGTVRSWLDKRWEGINLDDAKKNLISYIKDLIRFDPSRGDKGVPIYLAIGSGGSGKSYGFELNVELLSGIKSGDSLSFVNEDEKSVAAKISGAPPSYKGGELMPDKTIGKAEDINRKFTPLLFDESDKTKASAWGSVLEPLNDGVWKWNYNEQKYKITYGIYMTANFKNHDFIEGWEGLSNSAAKGKLRSAFLNDATKHFGEAFMTRVKYISIFKAPLRGEAKEYIDKKIKKTQGSKEVANFFIDESLSDSKHDEVLDLIYNKLKGKAVKDKASFREVSFGLIPTLSGFASEQNNGISLAGRQVKLGLDKTGNLKAELVYEKPQFRDYF